MRSLSALTPRIRDGDIKKRLLRTKSGAVVAKIRAYFRAMVGELTLASQRAGGYWEAN